MKRYKAIRKHSFITISVVLVIWFLTITAFAAEKEEFWVGEKNTSDYVQDYIIEKDDVICHYFFLMNTYDLNNITVQYDTDEIQEVYGGTLHREKQIITLSLPNCDAYAEVKYTDGRSERIYTVQSDLPSLSINLDEDDTLEEIHQDKNIKYRPNCVKLTDINNPEYNIEETSASKNYPEIKGRGNSTWVRYEKKPYQLRFNKKTSVLGMKKAKKWVLIANAGEPTLMCNAIALDTARKIGMQFDKVQ